MRPFLCLYVTIYRTFVPYKKNTIMSYERNYELHPKEKLSVRKELRIVPSMEIDLLEVKNAYEQKILKKEITEMTISESEFIRLLLQIGINEIAKATATELPTMSKL